MRRRLAELRGVRKVWRTRKMCLVPPLQKSVVIQRHRSGWPAITGFHLGSCLCCSDSDRRDGCHASRVTGSAGLGDHRYRPALDRRNLKHRCRLGSGRQGGRPRRQWPQERQILPGPRVGFKSRMLADRRTPDGRWRTRTRRRAMAAGRVAVQQTKEPAGGDTTAAAQPSAGVVALPAASCPACTEPKPTVGDMGLCRNGSISSSLEGGTGKGMRPRAASNTCLGRSCTCAASKAWPRAKAPQGQPCLQCPL